VKKLRGGVRARETITVKFTGNFRIVEEIPSQKKWNTQMMSQSQSFTTVGIDT